MKRIRGHGGTSLRNRHPKDPTVGPFLGSCGGARGGWRFVVSEVPLHLSLEVSLSLTHTHTLSLSCIAHKEARTLAVQRAYLLRCF